MITVNGVDYPDGALSIIDGNVYIDGKLASGNPTNNNNITVIINGNVDVLDLKATNVTVNGNVGTVETRSGNVAIEGDISGNVTTNSGNVKAGGSIKGSVTTRTGNIKSN